MVRLLAFNRHGLLYLATSTFPFPKRDHAFASGQAKHRPNATPQNATPGSRKSTAPAISRQSQMNAVS